MTCRGRSAGGRRISRWPRTIRWLGQGVASTIWGIDPYLDVFAADSLANGSRIEAASFAALVAKPDELESVRGAGNVNRAVRSDAGRARVPGPSGSKETAADSLSEGSVTSRRRIGSIEKALFTRAFSVAGL